MNTGSIPPPNPLAYEGQVVVPFINRRDIPQTTFNKFPVPTIWINTATKIPYILVNKELGVATWVPFGSGSGTLSTITVPGPVIIMPNAGNINFLNGTGMNITGSGDDITFNSSGAVPIQFTSDSGVAVPALGNLNILGGATGLTTTGASSTISMTGVLNVTHGGTGLSATVPYAILAGGTGTTTPLQQVSGVGTSGQVLTSNGAAALPTWQTNANGNVAGPGSSTDRAIATWNGITGDALFDNASTRITAAGEMTNTLQPAFLAFLNADDANVTGNGLIYQLGLGVIAPPTPGTPLTEVFDQGNDFDPITGTFTAPVTGRYMLGTFIVFTEITALMDGVTVNLTTSNGVYPFAYSNIGAIRTGGGGAGADVVSLNGDVFADMDAADTFTVSTQILHGAGDTANVNGVGSRRVNMYGYLAC